MKQTTEGKVAMTAISEPNFANMVVRVSSSRREVWISKEGKRRRDREEREKHRGREIVVRELTAGQCPSATYESGSIPASRSKIISPKSAGFN